MRIFSSRTSVLCALIISMALPLTAIASERPKEVVIEHLKPVFNHLLALSDTNDQIPLDVSQVGPLIEFVTRSKSPEEAYTFGPRNGGTSAYYEFTLNRSLKDVLSLAYSQIIPSYVTAPSSIRLARWVEVDGNKQTFPNLAELLTDLSNPVSVKGIEYIENTPDATSGAYYAYLLDRTLILLKHNGQPVMLSISNQKKKSNVGKKGLVLGPDDNWNYLYTGENGCTKPGFAWADSYMYNSSSIMVYYQTSDPVPKVRCGTFKWLKAGWAGINLAQPFHLREGIARFAASYKEVIESPALSDVAKVTHMFEKIISLPTEALRDKSRLYLDHLTQRHQNDNGLTRKWLSKLSKDQNYIGNMSREEMTAIVAVEFVKFLLGKDQPFDMSYFSQDQDPSKRPG